MRGKANGFPQALQIPVDHPRVCGEKYAFFKRNSGSRGSPPRVRGKVPSYKTSSIGTGITPACAGKRPSSSKKAVLSWDHPRVCGEKHFLLVALGIQPGSPPRVRGKVHADPSSSRRRRITPACAGKRLKKAHKIKDFDPVPIRFHLVFRRFERWCSNLPTPDGNVPV